MFVATQDKLSILHDIFGKYHQTGQEYLFYCPLCKHHKKKLSINLQKDKFKCWVCGYSGNNYRLVRRFGATKQVERWENSSNRAKFDNICDFSFQEDKKTPIFAKKLTLPDEFRTLCTNRLDKTSEIPFRFLVKRGLSKKQIYRWKIGYCYSGEYKNHVIFPSFDKKGELNYFIARAYKENFIKYKTPTNHSAQDIVFNELNIDFHRPIVLVEGVFDAIKAGDNAVPVLGSNLNQRWLLFQKIVKNKTPLVCLAFDADAKKKEKRVADLLMSLGIEVKGVDLGFYSDVGEMPNKEFEKRKKHSGFVYEYSFEESFSRSIISI